MLRKKERTKNSILEAIKKLEARGEVITLKKISTIVGCTPQNLRANHFKFILKNCEDLHYHNKRLRGSRVNELSDSQQEKMNEFMKHSRKSCGVDLVGHGEKFTL